MPSIPPQTAVVVLPIELRKQASLQAAPLHLEQALYGCEASAVTCRASGDFRNS